MVGGKRKASIIERSNRVGSRQLRLHRKLYYKKYDSEQIANCEKKIVKGAVIEGERETVRERGRESSPRNAVLCEARSTANT